MKKTARIGLSFQIWKGVRHSVILLTIRWLLHRKSAYLLTLLEDGSELPKPSDIHSIKASDGFTSFVSCDIVPNIGAKAVKKTLSIPEWMNERAVAMGINFSKTLQDALLAKLQAK